MAQVEYAATACRLAPSVMEKMIRIFPVVGLLSLLTLFSACGDNIGRLFDPEIGGGGGDPGTAVQAMVAGGISVDGRPRLRAMFPEGNGWPGSTPVAVQFNESLNETSVLPASGVPNLFIRVAGTTPAEGDEPGSVAVAASYDFLMGGRLVIMRPLADLDSLNLESYEVVATSDLRDVDGIRFSTGGSTVLGSFTTDEADSVLDGEILSIFPRDNADEQFLDTGVLAIFSKAADTGSVTTGVGGNFILRTAVGVVQAASDDFPLANNVGPGRDGRVLLIQPAVDLAPSTNFEVVVDNTITFPGGGVLDFRGRTPFSVFSTLAFGAVQAVQVGNPSAGFPNKVNSSNLATLLVDVDLPASTAVGDVVQLRIYGLDPAGGDTGLLDFVTAQGSSTMAGAHTLSLSLAGILGMPTTLRLLEGPLTLAAELTRGSLGSGFSISDASTTPALDVTAPTLTTAGPPTGSMPLDLLTDQEDLLFFSTASEELSAANLMVNGSNVTEFATAVDGRFMLPPVSLGRQMAALPYSLTLTDAAGNPGAAAITGEVSQRGVVTGSVAGGTLTVEVYDEASLLPLAGVTVVVEPDLPMKPAVGQLQGVSGADGRVAFGSLLAARYTVTLLLDGYHLTSMLNTPAGFVSLPLRPQLAATATLSASAIFALTANARVLMGCNILDDQLREEILSTQGAPTVLPATFVRPNRPYLLTAYSGIIEPSTAPTFTSSLCSLCGLNGITLTPAQQGIATGTTLSEDITLLPVLGNILTLPSAYVEDFGLATGLDTANLVATPTVRPMLSLRGFGGGTALGIGFATLAAGANYSMQASYDRGAGLLLSGLIPTLWISTKATDIQGNVARHRRFVLNIATGSTFVGASPPGIPVITAPGGASSGSPLVTFADRLDQTEVPGGFATHVLRATDGNGRQWQLFLHDGNGKVGATSIQMPDLAAVATTGLATGFWLLRAESHLSLAGTGYGAGDYVLEERRRQEVTFARSAPVTFTVN